MQLTRKSARYQFGSLRQRRRKNGKAAVWQFRYYETIAGRRMLRSTNVGTTEQYPTEADARRAVEALVLKLNAESPQSVIADPTFGALIDRYIDEEHLRDIKKQKAGSVTAHELSYSTAVSYVSNLERHIKPRWGVTPISKMRPAEIQEWLRQHKTAPKTKAHLKSIMHRLFEKAMLWEFVPLQRNPMELVEVRGISKRRKKPIVLTVGQFHAIVEQLPQPYRTMVMVAQLLGLRVSEILALKWSDVDFGESVLRVSRAVVHGRVKQTKTEYSEDELPLDEAFVSILQEWRGMCPASEEAWMFPNPLTRSPYHASPIQQDYIRKAGEAVGLSGVGWHTFRHTYRSLLDAAGAPIGVQQKLMRHAQVATTMNVYGNAQIEEKRKANSNVVRMVLPTMALHGPATQNAAS